MADTLGTIRGQMILDVKQAIASYTAARQAHISTVTALSTGAGAMTSAGLAIAGVGAAISAGFLAAVSAAAEFERKLDYFTAVSNTTQDEYDAIREKALQLGADTIYSANQIADSFIELGKSGVSARDIIDGIGEGVAALGAAADIPLDTAANIITSAIATFQLGADQAVAVADQLAGAANASIVEVEDLGLSLKYAGGVASSLGVPFSDLNTALAILGVNGIKGSTAGTSLRQVFLSLNGTTDKARKALTELGIITEDGGNKFYTAEGKAKSLAEVFQILQDATAGMSDQQRTATFQQIFATRALPSLIALTREGADGFNEMAAAIGETTAFDVASQRLDNLSGDIEILKGNLDTLMISSGSGFQSFARFIVQGITDMIQGFLDLPQGIQTALVGFTGFLGVSLVMIGTLGILSGAVLNIIGLFIRLKDVAIIAQIATSGLAAAQAVLNAVMNLNPIIKVLAVVALLVAGLIVLYNTSEGFRNAVQPIFEAFTSILTYLAPILTNVLGIFVNFITTIAGQASGATSGFLTTLLQLAATLGGAILTNLLTLLQPVIALAQILMSGLMPVIQALIPLVTSLAAVFGALFSGNLEALPSLLQTATDNFVTFIDAIATQLIPAIITVITNIIVALIGMLPTLVQAGITLFTGLITALSEIIPLVIGTLASLIPTLISSLIGMLPTLITAALTLFTGLVQALVTVLPMLIQTAITIVTTLITTFATLLPTLITTVVTILPGIITALVGLLPVLIEAAITLFTGLITGLLTALPLVITALVEAIPMIITAIVEAIPLIINAAINLFLGLVLGLVQALPLIITALVEAIPQIILAIVDALPLLIDAAIELFLGIVTGLIEALPQILEATWSITPKIVEALIKAVPKLIEAGKNLIQGLIDGIGRMGGALWNAAVKIANSAIDAIKGILGIKSPSTVFAEVGNNLIQGLINGVTDMRSDLLRTVSGVANSVAAVPFGLGLEELYNTVAATKQLEMELSAGAIGASITSQRGVDDTNAQTLAEMRALLKELVDRPNVEIGEFKVENPEKEPASDTLPRQIRKLVNN